MKPYAIAVDTSGRSRLVSLRPELGVETARWVSRWLSNTAIPSVSPGRVILLMTLLRQYTMASQCFQVSENVVTWIVAIQNIFRSPRLQLR
jgi:hypothetical protein